MEKCNAAAAALTTATVNLRLQNKQNSAFDRLKVNFKFLMTKLFFYLTSKTLVY